MSTSVNQTKPTPFCIEDEVTESQNQTIHRRICGKNIRPWQPKQDRRWCRVAAAGGDISLQSGDNLQNVRSNRDLPLQSPEVTITTGRPPPSWQPCHYMAYHHHPARPKYEHIILSYYNCKLHRLVMLAFFNNFIHRTLY